MGLDWEAILEPLLDGFDSELNYVMIGFVALLASPFVIRVAFNVGAAAMRRLNEVL